MRSNPVRFSTHRRPDHETPADTDIEADEIVSISMSNLLAIPTIKSAIDITDTATLTILNDEASIFASISDDSVSEGDAGSATASLTVSLSAPAPAGGATVSYATEASSAASNTDYAAVSNGLIVFAAGEQSKTINLSTYGDEVVEGDEVFNVVLSDPTGTGVGILDGTGQVTITNDDSAEISVGDASVGEGDGTVTIPVTMTNEVQGTVTLRLTTRDGTAAAGNDYTALSDTLVTFPAGNTSQSVTLSLIDDDVFEDAETVVATIGTLLNNGLDVTLDDTTGVVTITDAADIPTITAQGTDATEGTPGAASTGSLVFSVDLTKAVATTSTVDYTITAVGTTVSADLASGSLPISGVLTVPAGAKSASITIPVAADHIVEPDEALRFTISNPSDGTISTASATAEIIDDDTAAFIFVRGTANEDDGSVSGAIKLTGTGADGSAVVQGGVTVTLATADNNAIAATGDYTAVSDLDVAFTGLAGEQKTITFDIGVDDIVEYNEGFFVDITAISASQSDPDSIDTSARGTMVFADDDTTEITIADVTVDESSNRATVTLVSSAAVEEAYAIRVNVADGTAIRAGGDFLARLR